MSAQKIPPELKKITQYIRRAEELARDENNPESRLVSYYCRQYAVQIGIPLATTADGRSALGTILDALDADKVAMASFTKEESYTVCRSFAMKVFDKADAEDRGGGTGKGTAKTFYVAASFLDVLKQFKEEEGRGEEEATEEEKRSFYAKWKATDILKAIKEGREPASGGYGEAGDDDEKDGEEDPEEKEISDLVGSPPSMVEQIASDEQGFEIPPPPEEEGFEIPLPPTEVEPFVPQPPPSYPTGNVEKNNNLGHAATFDRPPMVQPSIPTINSMPGNPMLINPKKSSTFGKFFKSSSPSASQKSKSARGVVVSKDAMNDAKELAKFAMRALDAKDAELAVQRFQEVLRVLGH